jgi:hypothetical protein
MRASLFGASIAVALGGCAGPSDATRQAPHGRYAGVGIYPADRTWTKMSAAAAPANKATATLSDDQTVIVVVDSDTGELRQCGNMSGYCTGMNPWTSPLSRSRTAPVAVGEHAPEKTADRSGAVEAARETTPVGNAPPG